MTLDRRTAADHTAPMRPQIFTPALALLVITSLHCNREQGSERSKTAAPVGIPVDLPRAATGEISEQRPLLISIDAKGGVYVGAERTSDEALVDKLRALSKEDGALSAVINADRSAPHGRVVQIIDSCRLAGIQRISFGVHALKRSPAPRPVEEVR